MEKDTKVVLGISAAAILAWLLFFRKKAGAEGASGKISFAATPPATIVEGASFSCSVTVKNTSTQGGAQVGYTFKTGCQVFGSNWALLETIQVLPMTAGQTIVGVIGTPSPTSWTFTVPATGAFVGTATVEAILYANDGVTKLATTGKFAIKITSAVVIPGGTISW